MSNLNLFGYNSKKVDETYQNVGFLFNIEQISRNSKMLWVFKGCICHCLVIYVGKDNKNLTKIDSKSTCLEFQESF